MNRDEVLSTVLDMIYLISCAVNETVPDPGRIQAMDLTEIYAIAERHLLTAAVAMALESAGYRNERSARTVVGSVRRTALFDAERTAVLQKLEDAGIWHMLLKGSVLKDLYPMPGMRQMADVDILYDASRTEDLRIIMKGFGFYTDKNSGSSIHDHYFKPPVCNFEMHQVLFGPGHDERFVEYYQDVKNRLLPDEGLAYRYHFTNEDFYIYMIAHEYKHYSSGGTGLRSLLDTYVFCRQMGKKLDWGYITGELYKLDIADFEGQNRSLALHLFEGKVLTEQDWAMLDYIVSSGTYGTVQNRVRNKLTVYGGGCTARYRYMLDRFFVPVRRRSKNYAAFACVYPLFYKHKLLLPLLPAYRLGRNLPKVKAELRILFRIK